MDHSKRRITSRLAALMLAGSLALLAACSGEDDATGGSATATTAAGAGTELTPVTLMLNWTPNNHHAGIYAALANGWYEDAGLALTIVEPAQAGADQVVAAGGADFGISVAESLLPARAAGADVVSIATILPHNDSSMMMLSSSGITRPADFAGKTYGGYGGPLERELLDTLVACDGGDPAAVEHVEVGNIDYLAALERGRFDFVWVFEGWDVLRAQQAGAEVASVRFIDHLDCIPDWYTPVITASGHTLRDHPDLVRSFLEATARGYQLAIDEPATAARLLLEAVPELDAALVEASAEYYAPRYAPDGGHWGEQDPAVWSEFEGFLRQAGLLDAELDVSAAFTNDYLPRE